MNKCKLCHQEPHDNCEWNQGRCPRRPNFYMPFTLYSLINKIKSLFKKIS